MTRVMPTDAFSGGATSQVHLSLAKNERESFQLVYMPSKSGSNAIACEIKVSQHDAPVQVSWGQVGFVYVDSISNNPQGEGPSWWPDPILPSDQLPGGKAWLPSNVTSSLWFDARPVSVGIL